MPWTEKFWKLVVLLFAWVLAISAIGCETWAFNSLMTAWPKATLIVLSALSLICGVGTAWYSFKEICKADGGLSFFEIITVPLLSLFALFGALMLWPFFLVIGLTILFFPDTPTERKKKILIKCGGTT